MQKLRKFRFGSECAVVNKFWWKFAYSLGTRTNSEKHREYFFWILPQLYLLVFCQKMTWWFQIPSHNVDISAKKKSVGFHVLSAVRAGLLLETHVTDVCSEIFWILISTNVNEFSSNEECDRNYYESHVETQDIPVWFRMCGREKIWWNFAYSLGTRLWSTRLGLVQFGLVRNSKLRAPSPLALLAGD
jgi:hypothetical protein